MNIDSNLEKGDLKGIHTMVIPILVNVGSTLPRAFEDMYIFCRTDDVFIYMTYMIHDHCSLLTKYGIQEFTFINMQTNDKQFRY